MTQIKSDSDLYIWSILQSPIDQVTQDNKSFQYLIVVFIKFIHIIDAEKASFLWKLLC